MIWVTRRAGANSRAWGLGFAAGFVCHAGRLKSLPKLIAAVLKKMSISAPLGIEAGTLITTTSYLNFGLGEREAISLAPWLQPGGRVLQNDSLNRFQTVSRDP